MKDIVIGQRQIRREIRILLILFVVAVLVNVYAIIAKDTMWSELFTQLHYTIALALFLYVVIGILRLVVCGIGRLFKR
jgi:F0F1-type ATP synthase membrane subunit a